MIQQNDTEILDSFSATPAPAFVDKNARGPFSTSLSRITPITYWPVAVLTVVETGGIITYLIGSFTSCITGWQIADLSGCFIQR
jgi:hypothetical protein